MPRPIGWHHLAPAGAPILLLTASLLMPPAAGAWSWSSAAARHASAGSTEALSRAMRVGAPAAPGEPASVASVPDGAGGQYYGWSDFRDGDSDIYLLRVTNAGAVAAGWPASGLAVCTAPGEQAEPLLFPDGSNGVIVGWGDYRNNFAVADAYAQRVNTAGVPQWTTNGIKVASGSLLVDITGCADGTGGVVVAWTQSDAVSGLDVYAVRYDGAGALATGWSATGNAVATALGDDDFVSVAPAGAGGAIVSWVNGVVVTAQKMSAAGAALWSPGGVAVSDGNSFPNGATVSVAHSPGGAIVVWSDALGAMAQLVDGSGVLQWPSAGVNLFGLATQVSNLTAQPDGLGGAVVAGSGSFTNWVAQRVNGSGAVQWGASGVVLGSWTFGSIEAAADGSGGAFFAWDSTPFTGGSIVAQRVSTGGAVQWGASGVTVCSAVGFRQRPLPVLDGAGGLLVTWQDYRRGGSAIYSQRLNSSGVPLLAIDGVPAYVDPGIQGGSFTVADGAGGTFVAWTEQEATGTTIRARHLGPTGSGVGPSVAVTGAIGELRLESAVSDGAGGMIATWSSFGSPEWSVWAQRLDGSLARKWTANGLRLSATGGHGLGSTVISDGASGAILAWAFLTSASLDVRAQRVSAAGAEQWTAGGVSISSAGSTLAMAPDGSGGAIMALFDGSSTGVVVGQRFDSGGNPQWGATPVPLLTLPLSLTSAEVKAASDGAGGAIVLVRGDSTDALTGNVLGSTYLAQRVTSAGATPWGADPVTLNDGTSPAEFGHLVPDGANGAIAAWSDGGAGPLDVRAQRVNASGVTQWGANGALVCSSTNDQVLGGLVQDGSGGAVLTWADERSGRADIYAQRLNSSGVAQWTGNGVAVSTQVAGQFAPAASAGGGGVTFVSWTDHRDPSGSLIYAQRLAANGVVSWTNDGAVPTQIALVRAEATRESVRLTWYSPGRPTATVYRRDADHGWTALATITADANGVLGFEDHEISLGARLGYRLGVLSGSAETFLGEVWVSVPDGLQLAIDGTRLDPSGHQFVVAFTLPEVAPARLEVFDLAGRLLRSRNLDGLAAGAHVLGLGDAPAGGVYFLRLRQGASSVRARAVVAP